MPVMAGVKLVLDGKQAFIGGMKAATESVKKFDTAVEASAQNSGGFSGIFDNLRGIVSKTSDGIKKDFGGIIDAFKKLADGGLGAFDDAIGNNLKMLDSWSSALAAIPPPVLAATLAIAGLAAAVAAIVALGIRGAPLQGIVDSFATLASTAEFTSESLLRNMRAAANGTISDIELMTVANRALTGATDELANAFGEGLPNLLEFARVRARATGESVVDVYSRIVEAVKKGELGQLRDMGIILDSAQVYEQYAQSIGVAVSALSEQDKQLAILQATVAQTDATVASFGNVQETAADKMLRMNATITNIFDKLALSVQPLFEVILDAINMVLGAVQSIVDFIAPAIQFILEFLSALIRGFAFVTQGLYKFFVEPFFNVFGQVLSGMASFVREMLVAGSRLMGELANGIYYGLNQYVMPAVIAVATAIADFLVGQSPPPMGPLSKITEGGANVMSAWAEGFSGATLEPVEQVASFVDTALGSIGKLSLPQVERRLMQLDKAIAPFENKLAIVKSNFDKIAEPANAALRVIDKQIQASLEALNAGAAGSEELMRNLERQRQFFLKGIDAQQEAVDTATVQLALAKARQAEERTLLEIRKAQLPIIEQGAKAAEKAAKAASSAGAGADAPKTGAGASTAPLESALGTAVEGATEQVVTPFEQLISDMGSAFAEPLLNPETGQLAEFNANRGLLDEQLGRLNNANFGARISGFFSGIGNGLQQNFVRPFQEKVDEIITFFTDTETEGTLANTFVNFPTKLSEWLGMILSGEIELNLTVPFTGAITSIVSAFTSPENPSSLMMSLQSIVTNIPTWLGELPAALLNNFQTPFTLAASSVIDYLTNPENLEGLAGKLSTFFTGAADTEGTLAFLFGMAAAAFTTFATETVPAAFSSFGISVWNTIAVPFINVINWLIDRINEFLTNVNNGLAGVSDFLESVGVESELSVGTITFHLDPAVPSWIAGAADGGFMKGLFKVGERGEELMFSSEKVGVLPNAMTRIFESLMSVLAAPQPLVLPAAMSAGAGASSSSTDNSISATFNGQQDDRYIMQRLAMLRTAKF